ncbi:conserved exported hypothetical protein [Candidatus Desulfosporosinus infrequens]|uniref:DUF4234 domain-containing protein n=1 Tax=Candidatus Desulfosporosinus infrequens TaxID=2043169 RepID=A0A2U3KV46_9FIRM|nr:conserved exported hypothetical protein [Candidatus Desulfosporosinus infrequens]
MSKLRTFKNKFTKSLSMISMSLLANAPRVLADTSTPTTTTTPTTGGGALPPTNPFQVNWTSVMGGGVVMSLLPIFNYGLGLYGAYLLFHGIRHLLKKSKALMEGQTSYKEFIPVAAGFCMVILVLSGAWYHLLLSLLVPLNNAFSSTP